MANELLFPDGMEPLGSTEFQFDCHSEVPCFTVCCRKVDLILYPYDVIRLKNALSIHSEDFMRQYCRVVKGDNPFFPTVMITLTENGVGNCPFLGSDGCSVYNDRPTACRLYPLERAIDRRPAARGTKDFYFLKVHDYCHGHSQEKITNAKEYVRSQQLHQFNTYNDLWAEVDTFLRGNPFEGEGSGGPRQQMTFMALYNIDAFRDFVRERAVLNQFKMSRRDKLAIEANDEELLKFSIEWIKHVFGGSSSLVKK